jgi:hypothetical protein
MTLPVEEGRAAAMDKRTVKVAGVAYVALLAAVVIAGALAFRDLYGAARPSPGTEFAPHYQSFLTVSCSLLALCLGCWAGFLGVAYHRWLLGAAGLVTGFGMTVAALDALPWILYPFDQYAVSAAFLTSSPLCVGAFAVVTVSAAIRRWRKT